MGPRCHCLSCTGIIKWYHLNLKFQSLCSLCVCVCVCVCVWQRGGDEGTFIYFYKTQKSLSMSVTMIWHMKHSETSSIWARLHYTDTLMCAYWFFLLICVLKVTIVISFLIQFRDILFPQIKSIIFMLSEKENHWIFRYSEFLVG